MRIGSLELRREDFPDLSTGERTDRLLRQLNRFGSEVVQALNRGLTFADNIASEVRTVDVALPFPVRFKSSVLPSLVLIGGAWDVTDKSETPVSLNSVAWSRSSKGDEIVISDIGGVSAGKKYRVRLVIVAG